MPTLPLACARSGGDRSTVMESVTEAPLVSVLTPVHNGEPFLRQCIDSVLSQTYPRWDYTIVDNCSNDRTLEIAQEYAAKDSRIRIWKGDRFVGVEQSHNNAFRQISSNSKYCKVVAADDWLAPECLEKMVGLAEQHPNVGIVGAYGLIGSKVEWQGLAPTSNVVAGRELCRTWLMGGPYVFGSPTSLLFRSDVVRSRHAFYNEANRHCDSEVCLEVLEHYDFGFIHQVLTYQGVQEDSLTSFSKRMQTYFSGFILDLVKYGPKYLTPAELDSRIGQVLRHYYDFLAKQLYSRRDAEFWNFHRAQLAALGFPFSGRRLLRAVAIDAMEFANVKNVVKGLVWPFRQLYAAASR